MNQIQSLLEMLRDTDATAKQMAELVAANPRDDALAINAEAIKKRRADLARRLTDECAGGTKIELIGLLARHLRITNDGS